MSLQKIINENYCFHVIGLIQLSPCVYKVKTEIYIHLKMEKNRTSIGKCETCGDPSINIVFSYTVNVSIECRCKNKKESLS